MLATVVDTGGSTPRLAGAQMAVRDDDIHGTVGGGAFEQRVIQVARALLADPRRRVETLDVHLVRDLAMCCGGRMSVFMQKVDPAPPLRIYGAGHIGTELARVAALVANAPDEHSERDATGLAEEAPRCWDCVQRRQERTGPAAGGGGGGGWVADLL